MGIERRRAGFRLSWTANDKQGEDDAQHDEAASEVTPAAVDTMTVDAPNGETAAPETAARTAATETAATETPADGATEAAADVPAPAATSDGEPSEFLVSLVGAMRGVAESSRDASLTELRTAVDAHIEQLNTTSTEKDAELRRAADLDLQGVGDWEHDEIERIKAEAETRRDARRTRLEQQLAEHRTASEREVEAIPRAPGRPRAGAGRVLRPAGRDHRSRCLRGRCQAHAAAARAEQRGASSRGNRVRGNCTGGNRVRGGCT